MASKIKETEEFIESVRNLTAEQIKEKYPAVVIRKCEIHEFSGTTEFEIAEISSLPNKFSHLYSSAPWFENPKGLYVINNPDKFYNNGAKSAITTNDEDRDFLVVYNVHNDDENYHELHYTDNDTCRSCGDELTEKRCRKCILEEMDDYNAIHAH